MLGGSVDLILYQSSKGRRLTRSDTYGISGYTRVKDLLPTQNWYIQARLMDKYMSFTRFTLDHILKLCCGCEQFVSHIGLVFWSLKPKTKWNQSGLSVVFLIAKFQPIWLFGITRNLYTLLYIYNMIYY